MKTYEVWNPAVDKPANQHGIFVLTAEDSFAARREIAAKVGGTFMDYCARVKAEKPVTYMPEYIKERSELANTYAARRSLWTA